MSQHDQTQFDEVPRPPSPSVFNDDEPPSSPTPNSHLRPSSPQRSTSEQADTGHEEAKDDGTDDSNPPTTPPADTGTPGQATNDEDVASPSDDESRAASPEGYYSGTASPPSSSRSTSPARSPPESPAKKPAGPRPQPQSKRASLTSEQRPTDAQNKARGQDSTLGESDDESEWPKEERKVEEKDAPSGAQETSPDGASSAGEERAGEAQTSDDEAASPEKGDTESHDIPVSKPDGQQDGGQQGGQSDGEDEVESEGGDAVPDAQTQPRSASPDGTATGAFDDADGDKDVEDEAGMRPEDGGVAPVTQTQHPRSPSPEDKQGAGAVVGGNDGTMGKAGAHTSTPSGEEAVPHHELAEAGGGRGGEVEDKPQAQGANEKKGAGDGSPVVGGDSEEPPTDSQQTIKANPLVGADATAEQTAAGGTGEPEQPGEDSALTPLKGRRRKPASSSEVAYEGGMVKKGQGEMAEKANGEIAKEEKGAEKGGKEDKGSLRINIALDLEVEVHLTAKVKGDITIGLLS